MHCEFTGERGFVYEYVLRRLVVQQHRIFLYTPFDGRHGLADFVRQPSEAAGHHAEGYGLSEQADALAVLRYVVRQLGQRLAPLAERRRFEHGGGRRTVPGTFGAGFNGRGPTRPVTAGGQH